MLEKNSLFRRIQHHNIFRTFSRTYSRSRPPPQSYTRGNLHSTTDHHPTAHTHNHASGLLQPPRASTAGDFTRRELPHGQTLPPNLKTETSHKCTPLGQTVNLNLLNSQLTQGSHDKSSFLGSRRKDSDSLLVCIQGRRPRQNFKLKSSAHRENQQYDGRVDSSEFSLLDLERRGGWVQEEGRRGLMKTGNFEPKRMRQQVGRKVAAHLFSKYSQQIMSPLKVETLSVNSGTG